MNTLLYTIAGHTIAVETPHMEKTTALLPNFAPFRISDAVGNVLFRLSGDVPLAIPKQVCDDAFDWNGIGYEVYNTSGGWIITMELNNRKQTLYATQDWQYLYTDLSLTKKEEARFLNNFLIVAFGMASAPMKTVKVHASVIEKDGKALLFLGKSGTGKSTHSRLWQQFVPGCALLNDDEPVVRLCDNGTVSVFGTPWSGKTPCYKNQQAEVAAFVHLYQHPENILTPVKGLAAFTSLLQSTSVMRSNSRNKEWVTDTLSDILQRTPVYRLDCRPDEGAVRLTEQLITAVR
ncbi:MAG: hypothetical protein Q4G63_07075 [Bacteroidia bacterium]|nr:hypothetical protein [Bacteroidia bacterium]